jgi:hypothetical protein
MDDQFEQAHPVRVSRPLSFLGPTRSGSVGKGKEEMCSHETLAIARRAKTRMV